MFVFSFGAGSSGLRRGFFGEGEDHWAAYVNGKVVPARFTGVVPDNFKGGAEVVLKGRLAHDGFDVDPNGVMAKCPSKYQAASPAGASGS